MCQRCCLGLSHHFATSEDFVLISRFLGSCFVQSNIPNVGDKTGMAKTLCARALFRGYSCVPNFSYSFLVLFQKSLFIQFSFKTNVFVLLEVLISPNSQFVISMLFIVSFVPIDFLFPRSM